MKETKRFLHDNSYVMESDDEVDLCYEGLIEFFDIRIHENHDIFHVWVTLSTDQTKDSYGIDTYRGVNYVSPVLSEFMVKLEGGHARMVCESFYSWVRDFIDKHGKAYISVETL